MIVVSHDIAAYQCFRCVLAQSFLCRANNIMGLLIERTSTDRIEEVKNGNCGTK